MSSNSDKKNDEDDGDWGCDCQLQYSEIWETQNNLLKHRENTLKQKEEELKKINRQYRDA